MLFTFEKSFAHAIGERGVSGVAFFIAIDKQLQFNQGCFHKQAMLPDNDDFPVFLDSFYRDV